MALVLVDGSVFLHIPKTGGTWVTEALSEAGLVRRHITKKHADIDRLLFHWQRKGKEYTPPFIFCFVRHPLSWYESYFKFVSQPEVSWKAWGSSASGSAGWHPNHMLHECRSDDFNEFVRKVVRIRPGYVTEMYGWYTKPPVTYIGKQETLREDLIEVLKSRGLAFDADRLRKRMTSNVSDNPSPHWEPALREQVIRLEYGGLVRYGYNAS
jgi:hypothetical protein